MKSKDITHVSGNLFKNERYSEDNDTITSAYTQ